MGDDSRFGVPEADRVVEARRAMGEAAGDTGCDDNVRRAFVVVDGDAGAHAPCMDAGLVEPESRFVAFGVAVLVGVADRRLMDVARDGVGCAGDRAGVGEGVEPRDGLPGALSPGAPAPG